MLYLWTIFIFLSFSNLSTMTEEAMQREIDQIMVLYDGLIYGAESQCTNLEEIKDMICERNQIIRDIKRKYNRTNSP